MTDSYRLKKYLEFCFEKGCGGVCSGCDDCDLSHITIEDVPDDFESSLWDKNPDDYSVTKTLIEAGFKINTPRKTQLPGTLVVTAFEGSVSVSAVDVLYSLVSPVYAILDDTDEDTRSRVINALLDEGFEPIRGENV